MHMGEKVNACRVLMGGGGDPDGKRPQSRHRCRWKDKIELDLQEIRRKSVGGIKVDQDTDKWPAVINKAMQFRTLQNSEYF